MQGTYNGDSKKFKYLFEHASEVDISGLLQSGTTIATLTIDGQPNEIKAPAGGGVSCETFYDTGTLLATFLIGEDTYNIYTPQASEVEYTDLIDDELEAYEADGQEQIIAYHQPTYKIGELSIDGVITSIFAPPATGVVYETNISPSQGTVVGRLIVRTVGNDPQDASRAVIVDKDIYPIVVPSGGGGSGVLDVRVNGSSVVTQGIANIDLTSYATDSELASAVATLQANFQAGVDAIYNACVAKGSTPVSHSLSDVVDAIYAIGGNLPHAEITSSNTIPMRFSSSVEDNT